MKTVVLLNDLTTADVAGNTLYKNYIKLLEEDIQVYFLKTPSLVNVACPGCGCPDNKDAYCKMGMNFKKCGRCASHYVCPRPAREALENFYKNSRACR